MSIIKHPEQRVAMFIDAQNLYHSGRALHGRNVNFGTLIEDAIAGRKLVRALAYVITTESGEEQPFFEALTKLGIETKTKDLQIFAGGAKKADWDVGIAVDAIKMSHRLDAIILMSGDGDFIPLVEYLQTTSGIQVEVVSFQNSTSSRLIETVDDFVDISSNPRRYLFGRSSKSKSDTRRRKPKQ